MNQLRTETEQFLPSFFISLVDKAAVAQPVALIKHSAYANEKLLPPRLCRSLLYNELDEDGSVNALAKLV